MSAVEGGLLAAQRQSFAIRGGDSTTLEGLARAGEKRPDLAGLVPFWTAIYRVQLAARARLAAAQPPPNWALRGERLQDGRPQLDLEDLALEGEPLQALIGELEEAWRQHDPSVACHGPQDWPARLRQAFADPALTPGQRRQLSFEDTLACLALAPYLEWRAEAVVPLLQDEMEAWGRGRCPVCGGHPDLAALAGDPAARSLICSRCNSSWAYQRVGCPFCRDVDQQTYHVDGDETYRLYLCLGCRRYLKTVDARRLDGGLDPRVERLVTIGMDLAALEAGYGPR